VSPFDVNMASDAGFDVITPYTDVDLKEVSGLVQDAMFSRAPEDGQKTAVLIGGRDPLLALEMFKAAKDAMIPPHFEISVMADPSGAFTTAAGMIAVVEKHLKGRGQSLAGKKVSVFGATGPVGGIVGLMAAKAGAAVTLVGYDGLQRVTARADQFGERFGVALRPADGSAEEKNTAIVEDTEVILAAGKAGVQILSKGQLARARRLQVALDVNAVPPSGIEGMDAFADGAPLEGTSAVAFGALAVGNVKFKTEHAMLAAMRDAQPRRYLSVDEALETARRQA
jgi:methylene-tetrahydromethanopterin dehydrogenase